LSKRSIKTASVLETVDSKLVALAEHNVARTREDAEHEEALNVVLKEVAERVREKQNANKRSAGAAGGRKDMRDEDGMDVDESGGKNKK
jgi:effector-binding domain-containing protein